MLLRKKVKTPNLITSHRYYLYGCKPVMFWTSLMCWCTHADGDNLCCHRVITSLFAGQLSEIFIKVYALQPMD